MVGLHSGDDWLPPGLRGDLGGYPVGRRHGQCGREKDQASSTCGGSGVDGDSAAGELMGYPCPQVLKNEIV